MCPFGWLAHSKAATRQGCVHQSIDHIVGSEASWLPHVSYPRIILDLPAYLPSDIQRSNPRVIVLLYLLDGAPWLHP
jgi:hypothetical protein